MLLQKNSPSFSQNARLRERIEYRQNMAPLFVILYPSQGSIVPGFLFSNLFMCKISPQILKYIKMREVRLFYVFPEQRSSSDPIRYLISIASKV
jgi:hypothetical protein